MELGEFDEGSSFDGRCAGGESGEPTKGRLGPTRDADAVTGGRRGGPRRVMIFVDNENIYHNLQGRRINYRKLREAVRGGRPLTGARVYMGVPDPVSPGKMDFIRHLKLCGYRVLTKKLGGGRGNPHQKGVDVLLAVDMLQLAFEDRYDVAVLLSGDADFAPAIDRVQSLGKEVEVWSFECSLASALCDCVGRERVEMLDSIVRQTYRARRLRSGWRHY